MIDEPKTISVLTDTEREVLNQCMLSSAVTAKTFFPDRFYRPFSKKIHLRIFSALDDPSIQKLVIAAPRGTGKTSTVLNAFTIRNMIFDLCKFTVILGYNATQAQSKLANIRYDLETNRYINALFGDMKSGTWSSEQLITQFDGKLLPRGIGQPVRGELHRHYRPGLILGDDIEDKEGVRNKDTRDFLKDWWYSDVCGAIDAGRQDWKIVLMGTILHEDSLLANLLRDPSWYGIRLEICDDDYNSNWPEYMTNEACRQKHEELRVQGMAHIWAMEYRNKVVPADSRFKQQYFQYYKEADLRFDLRKGGGITSMVIIDPARLSGSDKSDFTAIVGVSIVDYTGEIYVRDVINERFAPTDAYSEAIMMAKRLGTRMVAVETTGLHDFVTYPLENAARSMNYHIMVIPVNNRVKKRERIEGLSPLYRQGLVWHNQACTAVLEEQLLTFPRSQYDDVSDCLSNIIPLMEEYAVYATGSMSAEEYAQKLAAEDLAVPQLTGDFYML